MTAVGVDIKKRRFLTAATSVVGAVGVGFTAYPFLASWMPSERAKALGAPEEADISKLELGSLMRVIWRGQVTWVLYRTERNVADLKTLDPYLVDPNSEVPHQPSYCKNFHRSIKPAYFVAIGICTHLGCSPTYRPDVGTEDLGGDTWKGGFLCPCHGSRFDLAGRVYKGVPAPTNLVVPPHQYLTDTLILVGDDGGKT